jgi:hypothetical protein
MLIQDAATGVRGAAMEMTAYGTAEAIMPVKRRRYELAAAAIVASMPDRTSAHIVRCGSGCHG